MQEHYYSEKPESELKIKEIKCTIKGKNFSFFTSSGVFSKEKADKGTLILIENAIIKEKDKVLDLGCGYGIVGITIKKLFPNTKVTCSDINERAVMLTEKNSKKNNVDIRVIKSDIFSNINETFDCILVNLPQNAGKETCFKIIEESYIHLNKNGTFQAVSRHQKGGREYQKKMKSVFGNVKDLAKESGYRVYISIKN